MRFYPSRSGSTGSVDAPKVTDHNGYEQIIRPSREMEAGLKILVSAVQSRPSPPFFSAAYPSENFSRSECARLGHTPARSSAPRSHSEEISSDVVREPMQLRVRVAHRRRFRLHDLAPHDQGRSVMVVVLAFRGRERVRHLN